MSGEEPQASESKRVLQFQKYSHRASVQYLISAGKATSDNFGFLDQL